jgi:hypothetical protein
LENPRQRKPKAKRKTEQILFRLEPALKQAYTDALAADNMILTLHLTNAIKKYLAEREVSK